MLRHGGDASIIGGVRGPSTLRSSTRRRTYDGGEGCSGYWVVGNPEKSNRYTGSSLQVLVVLHELDWCVPRAGRDDQSQMTGQKAPSPVTLVVMEV